MLDSVFISVNQWMSGGLALAAAGCFFWGMISVLLSPCHLASIPLMVAYVGGQNQIVNSRQATFYSIAFTVGLFITIALIGVICSVLGRMLGDVGNYWQVLVGIVLIWVALGLLGVEKCTLSGSVLTKMNLQGILGAFILGLAYGVLSGTCTFGFIAPILAIITVQGKIAAGVLLIILFGIGHCLPIAVAGSSAAAVKKLLENSTWHNASLWFRRIAGLAIILMGAYFIAAPLAAASCG